MTACGACGPLTTRFDQLRHIAEALSEGHGHLVSAYKDIATDPGLTADDKAAILQVAKFHEECAAAITNNTPTFTEEEKPNV